ncbi:choice-of-anchor J domain-containing protein [Pontibacter sp. G13]|uniref:choice-of-anchor J domain-containing protein n=1 Tax=Pontibacter sp. G13 TaxID=3074898 RepID=UPI00288ADDD9|nr:choice-of-anchor J domain-containing protein [Pontibacter sp. G13]WNJ20717.1 choice-of-anchor J domain-containing protein [Pontibacter sp. G13]
MYSKPKRLLSCLIFLLLPLFGSSQILLFEDFESSALPMQWSRNQADGSVGWTVGNTGEISTGSWQIPEHGRFAASNDDACNCDMSRDDLISPGVNLSGTTGVFLRFWAYYDGYFGSLAMVDISLDGGGTWTNIYLLDALDQWQMHEVDLGSFAGQSDIQLRFRHDDQGNYGTGVAIDDVEISQAASWDLAISPRPLPEILPVGALNPPLIIQNLSSDWVYGFDLACQLGTLPPVIQHIGDLPLAPLDTVWFNAQGQFLDQVGHATCTCWISQPNGFLDESPSSDTTAFDLQVVSEKETQRVLVEHFTQHNCFTCADQNPQFLPVQQQLDQLVIPIAYHGWWPSPNNDPVFTFNPDAHRSRIAHHGIVGVPQVRINGRRTMGGTFTGAPDGFDEAQVLNAQELMGAFEISLHDTLLGGNSLGVEVELTRILQRNIPHVRLRVAVIQDTLAFETPSGSNGESEFPHVMRYLLPDTAGISLAGIAPGATQSWLFPIPSDSIWWNEGMRTIAWVEDLSSKEVLAANTTDGWKRCAGGNWMALRGEVIPDDCSPNPTGQAKIEVIGGITPISFLWENGEMTANLVGQSAGLKRVAVTDAQGCQLRWEGQIPAEVVPEWQVEVTPPTCEGQSDAEVQVQVFAKSDDWSWVWDDGDSSLSRVGLSPGNLSGMLTWGTGCSTPVSLTIPEAAPITANIQRSTDDGFGNGSATVFPSGGVGPYEYLWSTGDTTRMIAGLGSGRYTLIITDQNGCESEEMETFVNPTSVLPVLPETSFSLYPNPFKDRLHVEISEDGPRVPMQVRLWDLAGRMIAATTWDTRIEPHLRWDIPSIPRGSYLLEVEHSQGIWRKRLIHL